MVYIVSPQIQIPKNNLQSFLVFDHHIRNQLGGLSSSVIVINKQMENRAL